MAKMGIKDCFAQYNTVLKNVQWSVSGWSPEGYLVLSLWDHHRVRHQPPGTLVFRDKVTRWGGPGNTEFRENISKAFKLGSQIRLVLVKADDPNRVEAGEDASKLKKTFSVKKEFAGKVTHWDGEEYIVTFSYIS